MKRAFTFAITALMCLFVFSCGSSQKTPGNALKDEFKGAPKWVLSPSSGDAICATGSAGSTRNPQMARTAATGRARTELTRQLDLKVQSMLKDYQSTTTGGEEFGTAANDEQHIVDVSKQITDTTLSGTEQKDAWISDSGTMYVLVCMEVEKFKGTINSMSQLSEGIRKAVTERADKAFKELSEEINKQGPAK
ncbi:LPP20 family lipoprotein [bacterium]|jgi:hypothetical protein|nr:LPP20 family lipoprotein [bacterium]